jgi:hypothetical protein
VRRITTLRTARVAACTSAIVGLALSSAGVLGACSSSSAPRASDSTDTDASTVLAANDGAAAVDDADAADAADAALDAGPRLCSDDGFCPTVVPEGLDGEPLNLRCVWGDNNGIVWATSSYGDILRWDGTSWTIHVPGGDFGVPVSIFGTGATDVWVATDQGLLLHGTGATSAALNFKAVPLPGDNGIPVTSLWGTGPKDLWAVGGTEDDGNGHSAGRALHYDGNRWTSQTIVTGRRIAYRAIWGSPGTGAWIHGVEVKSGTSSAVVLRRPAGATGATAWTPLALSPDPLFAASLSSDDSVWLGGVDSQGVPFQSYWHGTKEADGGFDFTQTDRFSWERSAVAFWGMAPNDTWVVGESGLVEHWNGTTWQPAAIATTPLPVVKSLYGIWGTSSTDFWIVGDEIALHKTTTGKP